MIRGIQAPSPLGEPSMSWYGQSRLTLCTCFAAPRLPGRVLHPASPQTGQLLRWKALLQLNHQQDKRTYC